MCDHLKALHLHPTDKTIEIDLTYYEYEILFIPPSP